MNKYRLFLKKKNEPGQSLVLISIMFFGFLALAALAIDGGSLYLNRRNVQTAVDSAAMAAAYTRCIENGSYDEIYASASDYAVNQNEATQIESVTLDDDWQVTVRAKLETQSFFSIVLGFENDTAYAEASAGCFTPGTLANFLPITWTCRPPAGGSSDETCTVHSIPSPIFDIIKMSFNFKQIDLTGGYNGIGLLDEGDGSNPSSYSDGNGGKMVYLVMDSDSFDPEVDCVELNPMGEINCDFNDDGVLDVEGGANRGWLLLDGTGASDLTDLMLNGFPIPIEIPHWLPGKNGVSNSVFINAHAIELKIALVPVFTAICEDTQKEDIPTNCPTEFQTGDLISGTEGIGTFYRVAGFAPFVVTCVSKGASEKCPAKDFANLKHNISTIEGYFLSGYYAGTDIDPSGYDLGVYTISLTK